MFLLEEKSTKELLAVILKRILPSNVHPILIAHNGKSDLRKSIPRKLNGWREPNTRFVVVHDQDSNDCRELKQSLKELCDESKENVLIRIACHEMEAWYFGDLLAVSKAYGKDYTALSRKQKYRYPDQIENPKMELRKIIPQHEQIAGARRIAPFMDIDNNTSPSFNTLINGIKNICSEEE